MTKKILFTLALILAAATAQAQTTATQPQTIGVPAQAVFQAAPQAAPLSSTGMINLTPSAPVAMPGLQPSTGIGGTAEQILQTRQVMPPAVPVAPVMPTVAATATPAQAATADPCAAFMATQDLYASCQNRMEKFKRMKDAQTQRITPPAKATATGTTTLNADGTPAAAPALNPNDPATIAATAAAAAVSANQSNKVTNKKGLITNKDKREKRGISKE